MTISKVELDVIKAYLYDARSHRDIQKNILRMPAPLRGGGSKTMQILHSFGIDGAKKGILRKASISEELYRSFGTYSEVLRFLNTHN